MIKEFEVRLPKQTDTCYNIKDFGAVSGGKVNNTEAFRICIKSGKDRQARELKQPSENIYIHDCTVIQSPSGVVEDICIRRMNMVDLKENAVCITMDYVHNLMDYHDPVVCSDDPEDIPEFRNILIEDCVCTGGAIDVIIHGLSGRPDTVHDITVKNCDFGGGKPDLLDCKRINILE